MIFNISSKNNLLIDWRRTTHLINKSIQSTLTATVLTAFAPLLALFADTLFVGNMLGSEALSALGIINPIITLGYVILYIFHMGANTLASSHLGAQRYDKARQYYTVGLVSTTIVAVVVATTLLLLRDTICTVWSPNETIAFYAKEYAGFIFLNLIPMAIASTLNFFVTGEGHPKNTTRAVLIGAIVNIILDPIFIGVLNWGIKGAAAATLISSTINAILQIAFVASGKSRYKLVPVKGQILKIIRENLIYGLGITILNICTNTFMIIANIIVAKTIAAEMFFGWGICVQIQYFLFAFCTGTNVGSIFFASSLRGEGDWVGVRYVCNYFVTMQIIFYGAASILMWAFPAPIAWIFGVHDWALGEACRMIFGSFSIYLAAYCTMCSYCNIFYIMKRVWTKIIMIIFFTFCVLGSFWIGSQIGENAMWISLMVGSVFPIGICVFYAWTRHLKDPSLTKFTMLPSWPIDPQVDTTVSYHKKNVGLVMEKLSAFIESCDLPKEKVKDAISAIYLQVDTAFRFADCYGKDDVFDVRVVDQGNCVKSFMKVYGKTFCSQIEDFKKLHGDILHDDLTTVEARKSLIQKLVDSSDYRYVFSMNETILQWNK